MEKKKKQEQNFALFQEQQGLIEPMKAIKPFGVPSLLLGTVTDTFRRQSCKVTL